MAPSEHPETPPEPSEMPATTGIQASSPSTPAAEAPPISLPPLPPPAPMDPTKFLRLRSWLDGTLVVVVLLFAFLVASFPVFNSDFFGQAATGRLILQGEYRFGVDPFVYSETTEDYFVNHSWLFALLMYGLYQLPGIGGAAVVIFKALLVVALAEILLRVGRRKGQSLWIPAACTALAILAVSSRLYLQPSCLSYLFLGLTLWLLTVMRPNDKRLWWLLPPLFALWVNCDQWFFLGPLTVALYLVGEGIQYAMASREGGPDGGRQRELRILGLVVLVGVAACLLNPHHFHAFTLPPEFGLSPAGAVLEQDPQFHTLFLSPLGKDFYQPRLGLSAAGLAYWPLLFLGLTSFVLVFGRAPWWRLVVWMGFALLSLYNVRLIPFFAIVAGPVMARNWLDYATQRLGQEPRLTPGWRNWSLAGRGLTVLLALALVIAAVPGWLQNQPKQQRRLGWSVRVDPSLQAMAQTIQQWRQEKLLDKTDPHWFNMHYEVADYLAWFAPGERVFLGHSLPYCRKTAEDYADIRQGLEQLMPERAGADDNSVPSPKDIQKKLDQLRARLRELHVRYWIFDDNSSARANQAARLLLFATPDEWVLCALHGRLAVFAWRDPADRQAPDPSKGLALDLKEVAFGPRAETAPPQGPEPTPARDGWETYWDAWWRPARPLSADREEAALYDFRFQVLEEPRRKQQAYFALRAWQAAVAAGAVAGSLSQGPAPGSLLALSWSSTYHNLLPPGQVQPARPAQHSEEGAMQAWLLYVNSRPIEPPTSLYLGIRAARRALRVNPEEASTYFLLGQGYRHLGAQPLERNFAMTAPRLLAIRRTQIVAALQQCLRLQPNPDMAAQAHEALYAVYAPPPRGVLRYYDAAVHHLREALDQRTAAGPPPNVSAAQYNQELDRMSAELMKLETELKRQRDSFDVRAASRSGLEKVRIALALGLPETALALLEEESEMSITAKDLDVVKAVTAAALDLGRLDTASRLLVPDPQSTANQPVRPDYLDLHVRLAAARGDYADADRLLADALRHAWQPPPGQPRINPAMVVGPLIGRILLGEGQFLTGARFMPWAPKDPRDIFLRPRLVQNPSDFWLRRWRYEAILDGLAVAAEEGEQHLMRGWLALEAGQCTEARKHFHAVRDTAVPVEKYMPEIEKLDAWFIKQEIDNFQELRLRHNVLDGLSKRYLSWLAREQQH